MNFTFNFLTKVTDTKVMYKTLINFSKEIIKINN